MSEEEKDERPLEYIEIKEKEVERDTRDNRDEFNRIPMELKEEKVEVVVS